MNLRYIKHEYGLPESQDDLRHDSISIMTSNMSAAFLRFNDRHMNQQEIEKIVDLFKSNLYINNNINIEWDQTS